MTQNPTHITGTGHELDWRYEVSPRTDSKVQLLTVGRIAVHGNWYGTYGENFIAWAPMPKRNKVRENELIAEGVLKS
jgi:hypothetical protein